MRFNKIYIEITNFCNLNCSFCSKDNRIKKEVTINEFEIILKKIQGYTKNIYLHVKGEPLLHSKLNEILLLTKKYNFNVRITTNGTLLKEKVKILNNFDNIKQINISLHSENKKNKYFENIFNTCELLSNKVPIIYRIWTLDNYKLNKLSTIIVDKIIKYYNLDNNFYNKVLNENNIKIKNNIYLDKDNLFIWPNNINDSKLEKGTCLATRNHIAILSNGDVVPCCLDSNAILKIGNILKDDMKDILNNDLFIKINKGFKDNKLYANICRNCSFRMQKFY